MVDFGAVQCDGETVVTEAGVVTLGSRDIPNVIAEDHSKFLRPFQCMVDASDSKSQIYPFRVRICEYIFQGNDERRQLSLFRNQNTLSPLKSKRCTIGVRHNASWYQIEPKEPLKMHLFIEGGSDSPRIRLRLMIDKLSLEVTFLPWSHNGADHARDDVQISPTLSTFTFSDQLGNVHMEHPMQLTDDLLLKHKGIFGESPPTQISYNYRNSICVSFQVGTSHLDIEQQNKVMISKYLQQDSRVLILTRGSKKLIESYNYFCAQPVPTPHLHRWAVRETRNEHAV